MIVDFFMGWAQRIAERGFAGPVRLGNAYLAGQDDPTGGRIVAFPTTDPLTPTTRIGGNPRARRTRQASLEIHVWGAVSIDANGITDAVQSLRNAEALLNTAINAALDLATGTIDFSPIAWNEQSTNYAAAGWLAVFTLTVEIPIVDTTYPKPPADELTVRAFDSFLRPDGTPAIDSPTCGVMPSP